MIGIIFGWLITILIIYLIVFFYLKYEFLLIIFLRNISWKDIPVKKKKGVK